MVFSSILCQWAQGKEKTTMTKGHWQRISILRSFLFLPQFLTLIWKKTAEREQKRTTERKTWRRLELNSPGQFKWNRIRQQLSTVGCYSFNHYHFENWLHILFFSILCSSPSSVSLCHSYLPLLCLVVKKKKEKNQDLTYISIVSTSAVPFYYGISTFQRKALSQFQSHMP